MKTRKHGNGMTHKQVVEFSNRLAKSATHNYKIDTSMCLYIKGWEDACKYFAHQLRKDIRYCEKFNETTGIKKIKQNEIY